MKMKCKTATETPCRGPKWGLRSARGVCCPHCETVHPLLQMWEQGFYGPCQQCKEEFTWMVINGISGMEFLTWADYAVEENGKRKFFRE